MVGLVSKVTKTPMRKRTAFLTNCPEVVKKFNGLYGDGNHDHVSIQGAKGGQSRSSSASRYPPQMCRKIAECVAEARQRHA
jgi:hypothetical protein